MMHLMFNSFKMAVFLLFVFSLHPPTAALADAEVLDIESRLELFVDLYLIEELQGVELRLQEPRPVPMADPPRGAYMTVIKDGDLYRAYYRSIDPGYTGPIRDSNGHHPGQITCYAESLDGNEWTYPDLGIFEVDGTLDNNAILAGMPPFSRNFSPFLDTREGVDEQERYKALAGHPGYDRPDNADGLHAFVSPDGIHWEKIGDGPVIPYQSTWHHAFDSQNVSFWSEAEGKYVCYFRTWKTEHGRLRTIWRTTSQDFRQWTAPVPTEPNLQGEHLYTNQTHPYFRAPHIYIALPSRFMAGRVGEERTRPSLGSTDIMLMTWRAGADSYERLFKEAFIWPGRVPGRWQSRGNFVALNVVPTGPGEMSIYHTGSGHRYVLRTDGFVAAYAGAEEGELVTRPLIFSGERLVVNFGTSAGGGVRVELQNAAGVPIDGFRLDECLEMTGDEIERTVRWENGPDLSVWAGRPVRLRFVMREAKLFSLRFRPWEVGYSGDHRSRNLKDGSSN